MSKKEAKIKAKSPTPLGAPKGLRKAIKGFWKSSKTTQVSDEQLDDLKNIDNPSKMLKNIKSSEELELRQKALIYTNLNKGHKAIDCLEKAIRINPEGAYSYYLKGRIKGDMTYFEEGMKDLSKAIELDNSFADAYSERGNIKIKLGIKTGNKELIKGGVKDLDNAVDLNPSPFIRPFKL